MSKTVLVTGASGFVGSNLVRRLLSDGHHTHALLRPQHQSWRLKDLPGELHRWESDLSSEEELQRLVGRLQPEWIFHLAAYGAYPAQTDASQMVETNLSGTIHLLEAALKNGVQAFVHAGSSSEYGLKDHPPSESEAIEPNSCYAVTKAAASLYCRYAAQRSEAAIRVMRLYSVYGPYEEPTRLMPRLILYGLRGELPPLARPQLARDYVHVDDVVHCLLLAAATPDLEPGILLNVGSGTQTTLSECVRLARKSLGIEARPEWASMPDRDWDTDVWVADPSKVREALGWKPEHSLQSGLEQTIRWFRDHPAMVDLYWNAQRRGMTASLAKTSSESGRLADSST